MVNESPALELGLNAQVRSRQRTVPLGLMFVCFVAVPNVCHGHEIP